MFCHILATFGNFWLLLATFGSFWLVLSTFCNFWILKLFFLQLWAPFGFFWLRFWRLLAPFGISFCLFGWSWLLNAWFSDSLFWVWTQGEQVTWPHPHFGCLCLPFCDCWMPLALFWLPLADFGIEILDCSSHFFECGRKVKKWLGPTRTPSGCLQLSFKFGTLSKKLRSFCRERAENLPRTRQEPAENPPYEPQTKLPFALQLLRKDFVRRQTLRQNRLKWKRGGGARPLGGFNWIISCYTPLFQPGHNRAILKWFQFPNLAWPT